MKSNEWKEHLNRYFIFERGLVNIKPFIKKMDSKRMGIVEPVFAKIRAQKKINYFTLRSKKKVNIQWNLFSIIPNLEKLRSVFI